jgi:hypothetical protein
MVVYRLGGLTDGRRHQTQIAPDGAVVGVGPDGDTVAVAGLLSEPLVQQRGTVAIANQVLRYDGDEVAEVWSLRSELPPADEPPEGGP